MNILIIILIAFAARGILAFRDDLSEWIFIDRMTEKDEIDECLNGRR